MKFYCIHEGFYEGVQLRLDQLKDACMKHRLQFVAINSLDFDYTSVPNLTKTDILYNCARGSQTLESLLLNNQVTTFYIQNPGLNQTFTTTDWSILHEKGKILAPRTIFNITSNRELLKKYVKFLGGFPIIVKAFGGTRGIGVIKIESWQNLISIADYLITTGEKFILRQFIEAKSGCRLIVLGNEVIAGADFTMNRNDFRNAIDLTQIQYINRSYTDSIRHNAVKATHLANLEFSGVDFLEDINGNYYLLEVNFPTGFSGLIEACGVDIPYKMIEYLKGKSQQ